MQADWMMRTEAVIHELTDALALADAAECLALIRGFLDRFNATADDRHEALLRLMLINLCRQIVCAVHSHEAPGSCGYHMAAWQCVSSLTDLDDRDPRLAFVNWTEHFLAHAAKAHPPAPAQRAAAAIRAEPAKTWTLRELAGTVGVPPGRLSRQFMKRFSVRPAAYVHLVRVLRAIALFHSSAKVETVASEVGYRSKKDFYAALKQWVGLTPTELRALPDDERRWLECQLRARLVRRPSGQPAAGTEQRHTRRIVVGIGIADQPVIRDR